MSEKGVKLDRREFLKVLAAAGASAAFVSTIGPQTAAAQGPVTTQGPVPELVASLTGSAYNRAVTLATAGPGHNMSWQPGDSLKFLPPVKIDDGKYGDAFAALPKEKLLTMYNRMVTSRKWESVGKDVYLKGADGFLAIFHMYIGEEAVPVGVCGALNDDDFLTSTHRGHADLIAKGADITKMAAEIFGRQTGYNKGYGGSMHIVDMSKGIMGANGIVGGGWLLGAGAALRAKIDGTKQVAVSIAGDGAANSRYFFNSIRNAVTYNLPFIAFVRNNFQNVSTPIARISATKYQAELAKGLGIPCVTVDGMDVAAVYSVTKEAVDRARNNGGPTVIEAMTYRYMDHANFAGAKVGNDAAFGLPYRTDDEVRQWMTRDPIVRFENFLTERNIATADELTKIKNDVQAAVVAAWDAGMNGAAVQPQAGLENTWANAKVEATQFFDRKGTTTAWSIPEYLKDKEHIARVRKLISVA
jgi:pyruvate dehydrogenase E1 component alpha subunit